MGMDMDGITGTAGTRISKEIHRETDFRELPIIVQIRI
jgi:hypothetical protein